MTQAMGARARRRARGFTLIEIGVVLVLTGVLLALAVPGLARLAARLQVNTAQMQLEAGIAALPRIAYARGEEGGLVALAERHLELPADWSLVESEPIYIRSNGVCSGGELQLLTPAGERRLLLEPPFCTVAESR